MHIVNAHINVNRCFSSSCCCPLVCSALSLVAAAARLLDVGICQPCAIFDCRQSISLRAAPPVVNRSQLNDCSGLRLLVGAHAVPILRRRRRPRWRRLSSIPEKDPPHQADVCPSMTATVWLGKTITHSADQSRPAIVERPSVLDFERPRRAPTLVSSSRSWLHAPLRATHSEGSIVTRFLAAAAATAAAVVILPLRSRPPIPASADAATARHIHVVAVAGQLLLERACSRRRTQSTNGQRVSASPLSLTRINRSHPVGAIVFPSVNQPGAYGVDLLPSPCRCTATNGEIRGGGGGYTLAPSPSAILRGAARRVAETHDGAAGCSYRQWTRCCSSGAWTPPSPLGNRPLHAPRRKRAVTLLPRAVR